MEFGEHGQAARDALNAQVPPVNLSTYETAPVSRSAGVLAGAPVVNHCVPGAGPDAAGRIHRVLPYLSTAGQATHQLTGDQLGDLATDLLEAGDRIERSLVFVLADAIGRGVLAACDAGSPAQWLTGKLPCLEPAQAHRIAQAATAVLIPANAALAAALAEGAITVRCLVTALRQLPKVAHALPCATREELLGYFLTVAGTGTSRDLNDLAKKVIATYGGDQAPRDEDRARDAESLTFRDLPCGLTRVTADLSPGDATTFRSAIEALAKPGPGTTSSGGASGGGASSDGRISGTDGGAGTAADCEDNTGGEGADGASGTGDGATGRAGSPGGAAAGAASITDDPERWLHGTGSDSGSAGTATGSRSSDSGTDAQPGGTTLRACRDPRPAPKRRADALMELVNAAQRVSTNDAGRASARATVTVPLSVLVGSLVNAGFGTTDLGEVLDAGAARTMACNAQLVPMVLGSDSQPLDVGRASRLFTPSTRAAIVHRDGCCTYPGCDRPAPWCEAHHAVPWWVGGRSELSNGVLLCSRHHHVVHSRGYLPRITTTGVSWSLVEGEMPTRPLDPGDPLTHGPGGPPHSGEHAA